MPELPEVETVCRALSRVLPGRTITGVEVFTPALREPLLPLREARLEGRKFLAVRRRARYLLLDLDDDRTLLIHLGMTGVIRVESAPLPRRKHEHFFLHLDSGSCFRFECVRRFSIAKVPPRNPDGSIPELSGLGPEPFDPELTPRRLYREAQRRSGPVKNFLMDNRVVVGVGNIYAAESLFAAGLSPLRPANRVRLREFDRWLTAVREVLTRAIACGGTTIADFQSVDGSEGKFSQCLQIYGRAGQPCLRCGTSIECVRIGGRSSCYCPRCQR